MPRFVNDPHQAASELSGLFEASHRAVFFGGAGVSTASGIPDFRSPEGLYNQRFSSSHSPEELLSRHFFRAHPEEFFDFYRTMMCAPAARPNRAHLKLAELEAEGSLSAVITQNIDGLHQAAGSRNVIELHGSTHRNVCQSCCATYSQEWVLATKGSPRCPRCGGVVRPDVVLYEEPLGERNIARAIDEISSADLLVIGGTSLVVYPAADLVRYFRGSRLVVCNKQPTPQDASADLVCSCNIALAFDW